MSSALLCEKRLSETGEMPHATIEELVLSGNRIGDSGVSLLCQNLFSQSARLVSIELNSCGLNEASASALRELLAGTKYFLLQRQSIKNFWCLDRTLRQLDLSWNNFGVRVKGCLGREWSAGERWKGNR